MTSQTSAERESFTGWCVLELMGHRRLAGHLSEQNVGGAAFIRIDVPSTPPVTQLYSPGSVYAITPCTEEVARAVAAKTRTDPVSLLGINLLPAAAPPTEVDDGEAEEEHEDLDDEDDDEAEEEHEDLDDEDDDDPADRAEDEEF